MKKIQSSHSLYTLALLLILQIFGVANDYAIPTYARQYRLSCSSCHLPVPKLNSFGSHFEANGFQLEGLEDKEARIETADSSLSLMRELPIAIRFDGFARVQPNEENKTDLEWPMVMKIFSSGQIKKDVSYFFYFLMNEGGEIPGVEDAFIYFNNIGGQPLDVTVGQFQVADMIFKRELRPTFEDYAIYEIKPGLTKADLTYDRGIILNYSLPVGTDFYVSVVNGNGIGASSEGFYDSDPYKNFVVRVAQPFNSCLSLGTLGYFGKESSTGIINTFKMAGGDVTISLSKFEILGQYLYRHDTNPYFVAGQDPVNSYGGFIQLMYAPSSEPFDWYAFILYNNVRSDITDLKYQSITGNLSYLLSRNFKLTAEYSYEIERLKNSLTLGFMTAF